MQHPVFPIVKTEDDPAGRTRFYGQEIPVATPGKEGRSYPTGNPVHVGPQAAVRVVQRRLVVAHFCNYRHGTPGTYCRNGPRRWGIRTRRRHLTDPVWIAGIVGGNIIG